MSNYIRTTKNPWTGEWQEAEWLDDYFGHHKYAVRFPNGDIADPRTDPIQTKD